MSQTTDYNKLNVNQLKEELKKRSLDQSGKKADLIARLESSDLEKDNNDNGVEYEEEEDIEGQEVEQDPVLETSVNAEVDEVEEEAGDVEAEGEPEVYEENGVNEEENQPEDKVEQEEEEKVEEEQTEEEKKEAAAAETAALEHRKVDDERIAGLFNIDMKREKDSFQMTWHGSKFTVPFRGEICADLAASMSKRSILVTQVENTDIVSQLFREMIENAEKFLINFHNRQYSKTSHGHVRFVFASVEDAEKYKAAIKQYKESLEVTDIRVEDDFGPTFVKDTSNEGDSTLDRLVYVGNLPEDITVETLKDLFPDSTLIVTPNKKESADLAMYAYVQFDSAERASEVVEQSKDLTHEDHKLFVIKSLTVKRDKFGLLTDSLRSVIIEKLRKFKRIQKDPWNKNKKELEEIERAINFNMEKLNSDTVHRREWGMEFGALDEERINEQPQDSKPGDNKSAPWRGGRGGRGGFSTPNRGRGLSNYGGSYAINNRWDANRSGGWNQGGYGGMQSGYNNYGLGFQSYGGGFNSQGGNYAGKRRASDNFGGDWKRTNRGRGGAYGF